MSEAWGENRSQPQAFQSTPYSVRRIEEQSISQSMLPLLFPSSSFRHHAVSGLDPSFLVLPLHPVQMQGVMTSPGFIIIITSMSALMLRATGYGLQATGYRIQATQ
ncbi:uncharacterized protein BP01DRAFT_63499 [Aspergillus saccharolyticus JOP 1030-1]|uniref:Uncharacterized protein n=1 Tax=Aspergillus saccharolyticus JOP 1030-1 TaxID=1450539 RepID=A0A319ADP9_9EURO|nr:hypothetical protein BP01DRAFT_63499 [Aspergillus saccharolyticus JOP 1030-1]PYH44992.1 hypothetical protein BP01DRAFT_63499 [Aspergillus saccharolyticus JOP 1030-1]